MLKKIHIDQLRPGMFVQEFCGSWMEHPFWRTSFLIKQPGDLKALRETSIREVWIDVSRGLDVVVDKVIETRAEADARADHDLQQAVAGKPMVDKVPMAVEMRQAARIYANSKAAMYTMFEEARMGKVVNAESARGMVEEISISVMRNPAALISLARIKTADEYTYMHSVAVCTLMIALARQLGLSEDETREAGVAGLLHDLGKAKIPSSILNKPGRLDATEFGVIKAHPLEGHRMLVESAGVGEAALDVVLHHHEKMDGSGYPFGIPGEKISLFSRMGAVCDVYDAITSNRPYKLGWNPSESLRKMAQWADGHFDRRIFQNFVKSVGIYPVGSFLRLASGRMGVVIEQGENSLLTPKIKVFFSAPLKLRIKPEIVDLASPANHDTIVCREEPADWGITDVDAVWSEGLVKA